MSRTAEARSPCAWEARFRRLLRVQPSLTGWGTAPRSPCLSRRCVRGVHDTRCRGAAACEEVQDQSSPVGHGQGDLLPRCALVVRRLRRREVEAVARQACASAGATDLALVKEMVDAMLLERDPKVSAEALACASPDLPARATPRRGRSEPRRGACCAARIRRCGELSLPRPLPREGCAGAHVLLRAAVAPRCAGGAHGGGAAAPAGAAGRRGPDCGAGGAAALAALARAARRAQELLRRPQPGCGARPPALPPCLCSCVLLCTPRTAVRKQQVGHEKAPVAAAAPAVAAPTCHAMRVAS